MFTPNIFHWINIYSILNITQSHHRSIENRYLLAIKFCSNTCLIVNLNRECKFSNLQYMLHSVSNTLHSWAIYKIVHEYLLLLNRNIQCLLMRSYPMSIMFGSLSLVQRISVCDPWVMMKLHMRSTLEHLASACPHLKQ